MDVKGSPENRVAHPLECEDVAYYGLLASWAGKATSIDMRLIKLLDIYRIHPWSLALRDEVKQL